MEKGVHCRLAFTSRIGRVATHHQLEELLVHRVFPPYSWKPGHMDSGTSIECLMYTSFCNHHLRPGPVSQGLLYIILELPG